MTQKEIGEFVEASQDNELQKFKESAVLLDGLATQIRKYFSINKSAWIKLNDLYPSLYGKDKPLEISPEEKQKMSNSVWKSFLGV